MLAWCWPIVYDAMPTSSQQWLKIRVCWVNMLTLVQCIVLYYSVMYTICKRCSFECDMGKYSTRSMNMVWANTLFIEHVLYFHISHEKWTTFVFSHTIKSHIYKTTIHWPESTARVRYGLIPIYVSEWKPQHIVWEITLYIMYMQTVISMNIFISWKLHDFVNISYWVTR